MHFVANLRNQTIEAFQEQGVFQDAFLLSAHRATPTAVRCAQKLRQSGTEIFADNGSKQFIDLVINDFQDEATAMLEQVRQIRRRIGRTPRGRAIPSALRRQASDLAASIVDRCTALSDSVKSDELLDIQLEMLPTHLFAQEDFAVACLVALNIERETTGWNLEHFNRQNRRSLTLYERAISDPRCNDIKVYAVLNGVDYNTARAAGQLAAEAHVKHIAFGAASINLDASAVDFFVLGRGCYHLPLPTPRRYVRLAQIVRGLFDGYRDRDERPDSLHVLGLGNPAMFPIVAAAAEYASVITTDATSPILDAVRDQVIYDPEHNGDRLTRIEVASRIVNGGSWPCTCPFCLDFRNLFGHSEDSAVQWFENQGRPQITRALLETMGPLALSIPLFASPAGSDLAKRGQNTYIAHNHFVLDQLAKEYPDGPDRRGFALLKLRELLGHSTSVTTTRGLQVAMQILNSQIR